MTADKLCDGDAAAQGPRKRVLMVAFHYPPCRGSSGLQRTLSFTRYLPCMGWLPVVLTASSFAYPDIGYDQLADIPEQVPVHRAFSLDAARHLSIKGRYLDWMALPDSWSSWALSALPLGMRLIWKYQPSAIWSTYPIATAHMIAYGLHRLSGIPWVADFRDPMTEEDSKTNQRWPSNPRVWRARQFVEKLAVRHAARLVFATDGARRLYADRYPHLAESRWTTISNGYDEGPFAAAEKLVNERASKDGRPLILLHSGVLYPTPDRDPSAFFAALAKLKATGTVSAWNLRVVLRASGFEDHYRGLIQHYRIEDIVALEPPIPYRKALAEMLDADGLLIFQGRTSNPAIPAKLYEYFRAQRPIFAMVDSEGDTAETLRQMQIGTLVPLDSENEIARALGEFLSSLRAGELPTLSRESARRHSRKSRTAELVELLDEIASARARSVQPAIGQNSAIDRKGEKKWTT